VAEILQGTKEWKALRCGKVTASRIADVTAKARSGSGPSATRENYMAELMVERLTGVPTEGGFKSAEMRWGNEKEAEARELYEFRSVEPVQRVAFIDHPRIPMAGCSPDLLVGRRGLAEFKAPLTKTHVAWLRSDEAPAEYRKQQQWQLACCPDREWCDFVSYDPRLPLEMREFRKRVYRDEALIAELEREVVNFIAELERRIAELRSTVDARRAA
jgi:putative phage-type endonuclease